MGHKIKPKVCEGCKVPKGWGEELIIENNEMYCGKLLIFKKGCRFSMHYHLIKDETWYVARTPVLLILRLWTRLEFDLR